MDTYNGLCKLIFYLRYVGIFSCSWLTVAITTERFITVSMPLEVVTLLLQNHYSNLSVLFINLSLCIERTQLINKITPSISRYTRRIFQLIYPSSIVQATRVLSILIFLLFQSIKSATNLLKM